jgi:peptidoglycan/xylan/chitin deacetylase (PgdA/CDA1 family)
MKCVTYHYVGRPDNSSPRFHSLSVRDFRAQLDFFQGRYRIPDLSEFIELFEGTQELPEDVLILTFDDGLKDHYQYVLPELVQRKIFGIFYIPTQPLQANSVLDVHKIHLLLGLVDAQKLIAQIKELIDDDVLSFVSDQGKWGLSYAKHNDPIPVQFVKHLLNYQLDYKWTTSVLDKLMQMNGTIAKVEDLYLTRSQVVEMHEAGMLIGSHSISHRVMARVNEVNQRHEIRESFRFLTELVGHLPFRTYAHPYGGDNSFNAITEEILAVEGCRCSFSVGSGDIRRRDLLIRPHGLPRYDCNMFLNS